MIEKVQDNQFHQQSYVEHWHVEKEWCDCDVINKSSCVHGITDWNKEESRNVLPLNQHCVHPFTSNILTRLCYQYHWAWHSHLFWKCLRSEISVPGHNLHAQVRESQFFFAFEWKITKIGNGFETTKIKGSVRIFDFCEFLIISSKYDGSRRE